MTHQKSRVLKVRRGLAQPSRTWKMRGGWLSHPQEGPWSMTVGSQQLSQWATLNQGVLQSNCCSRHGFTVRANEYMSWYLACLLMWQKLFSPSLAMRPALAGGFFTTGATWESPAMRPTRSSLLSAGKANNSSSLSWLRGPAPPGPMSQLSLGGLHHHSLPGDCTLLHYTDDSTLVRPSEQAAATTLDLSEDTPGPSGLGPSPSRLWHLASPTPRRGALLGAFLGFGKEHTPYMGASLWPTAKWYRKLLVLSRAQNKRRLCSRSRQLCRLLCPWPYDPADLMVLEVSAAERMMFRVHYRPWRGITAKALGISEQSPAIPMQVTTTFPLRKLLACCQA